MSIVYFLGDHPMTMICRVAIVLLLLAISYLVSVSALVADISPRPWTYPEDGIPFPDDDPFPDDENLFPGT
jgi:hypothetical protein